MKNFRLSVISLILSIAILFSSVIIPSYAVNDEGISQNANTDQIIDYTQNTDQGLDADELVPIYENDIVITEPGSAGEGVYEILSMRDENTKYISLGGGRYQAVSYMEAVHRKASDGSFVDIDNRISLVGDKYITPDSRVSFDKNNAGFTIDEEGYKISLELSVSDIDNKIDANENASLVEITNHEERTEDLSSLTALEKLERIRNVDNKSTLKYVSVNSNTDVEYILASNDVKENIIVKNRADGYEYSFLLTLDGLYAEENEDGSISLCDSESDENKYVIPAPYMYDANDVYSYDVEYELIPVPGKDGIYILLVTADEEFINSDDRAFPVVIDPTITPVTDGIQDTYINSSSPNINYGSNPRMYINGSTRIAYVKIEDPTLPEHSSVLSASINVPYQLMETGGRIDICAVQMACSWSESTLTWNAANAMTDSSNNITMGYYNSYMGVASLYSSTSYPQWMSLNITNAANKWYAGTHENYGVALIRVSGDMSQATTYSKESTAGVCTYMTVEYSYAGVYAIRKANTNVYMKNTTLSSLAWVFQDVCTTAPVTEDDRDNLFKISYRPATDDYVIRSMLNNEIIIYPSISNNAPVAGKVSISGAPATDENLPTGYTWKIKKTSDGYCNIYYKSGSTKYYVRSTSDAGDGPILGFTTSSTDTGIKWEFYEYTGDEIGKVRLNEYSLSLACGETFDYDAYMYTTEIGVNGPLSYSVTNLDNTVTDKATIDPNTGVLTALKEGTIIINVTYPGAKWIWMWNIEIKPCFVEDLIDKGYVAYSDIRSTDDGFYMLTKSLADILTDANINTLAEDATNSDSRNVTNYYDDWYIFAVENATGYSYGMLKMREPENDAGDGYSDGDTTGVTVSFVNFNYSKLLTLLNSNTTANSYDLFQNLNAVTGPGSYDYDEIISNYFRQVESKAAYLIADQFIEFIVDQTCINGVIYAPPNYVDLVTEIAEIEEMLNNVWLDNDTRLVLENKKSDLERIPNAVAANNSEAGYSVYNATNNTINIYNPNNLTKYEKYAILATHTANVTFNSFAAEVQFHADALYDWMANIHDYYIKALRADMTVGEEYESGFFDEYYNLNSDIVRAQAEKHGEY